MAKKIARRIAKYVCVLTGVTILAGQGQAAEDCPGDAFSFWKDNPDGPHIAAWLEVHPIMVCTREDDLTLIDQESIAVFAHDELTRPYPPDGDQVFSRMRDVWRLACTPLRSEYAAVRGSCVKSLATCLASRPPIKRYIDILEGKMRLVNATPEEASSVVQQAFSEGCVASIHDPTLPPKPAQPSTFGRVYYGQGLLGSEGPGIEAGIALYHFHSVALLEPVNALGLAGAAERNTQRAELMLYHSPASLPLALFSFRVFLGVGLGLTRDGGDRPFRHGALQVGLLAWRFLFTSSLRTSSQGNSIAVGVGFGIPDRGFAAE